MSAAQVEKPKAVAPKPHEKLIGARLVNSLPFAGSELESIALKHNCDSLAPARLEPDGSAVVISSGQRADGLLARRAVTNLNTRETYVDQAFIPFANIRSLQYGE